METIKISQLRESTSFKDLYTIGTDENNESVKISLEGIDSHATEALDMANNADSHATEALDIANIAYNTANDAYNTANDAYNAANAAQATADSKQDKLTAGTGIEITSDSVINVTLDTTIAKVVTALPDEPDEADKNKIFLVPSSTTGTQNVYTEYIYVDGAWEKLGEYSTSVDLSDYLTIANAANTYATQTSLNSVSNTANNAYNTANSAYSVANNAYNQANAANTLANSAYNLANTANATANSALDAKIYPLEIEATNYKSTPNNSSFTFNGTTTTDSSRGISVYTINRSTLAVSGKTTFDTYSADQTIVDDFIDFINDISDDYLILLLVRDSSRCTEAMREAIANIGGLSEGVWKNDTSVVGERRSHYVVGMKGLRTGQGYEEFADALEEEEPIIATIPIIKSNGLLMISKSKIGASNVIYDGTDSVKTILANAYNQANNAYNQANSANTLANTANATANNALPKAGGTMTGNITLGTSGAIIYSNGHILLPSGVEFY